MALDMANSAASSAAVRVIVSFYLVATDDTSSSSARTSAIHKVKINVPLSGDEHRDLFKAQNPSLSQLKSLRVKAPEKPPRSRLSYPTPAFIILRYTKLFPFLQEPLKTHVNSKYQSKGSTYILHILTVVKIRLFNMCFWERKTGFGIIMKKVREAGFS